MSSQRANPELQLEHILRLPKRRRLPIQPAIAEINHVGVIAPEQAQPLAEQQELGPSIYDSVTTAFDKCRVMQLCTVQWMLKLGWPLTLYPTKEQLMELEKAPFFDHSHWTEASGWKFAKALDAVFQSEIKRLVSESRFVSLGLDEVNVDDVPTRLGVYLNLVDGSWNRRTLLLEAPKLEITRPYDPNRIADGTVRQALEALRLRAGLHEPHDIARKLVAVNMEGPADVMQDIRTALVVRFRNLAPFVQPSHCITRRTHLGAEARKRAGRVLGEVGRVVGEVYFKRFGWRHEVRADAMPPGELLFEPEEDEEVSWLHVGRPLERLLAQYDNILQRLLQRLYEGGSGEWAASELYGTLTDAEVLLAVHAVRPALAVLEPLVELFEGCCRGHEQEEQGQEEEREWGQDEERQQRRQEEEEEDVGPRQQQGPQGQQRELYPGVLASDLLRASTQLRALYVDAGSRFSGPEFAGYRALLAAGGSGSRWRSEDSGPVPGLDEGKEKEEQEVEEDRREVATRKEEQQAKEKKEEGGSEKEAELGLWVAGEFHPFQVLPPGKRRAGSRYVPLTASLLGPVAEQVQRCLSAGMEALIESLLQQQFFPPAPLLDAACIVYPQYWAAQPPPTREDFLAKLAVLKAQYCSGGEEEEVRPGVEIEPEMGAGAGESSGAAVGAGDSLRQPQLHPQGGGNGNDGRDVEMQEAAAVGGAEGAAGRGGGGLLDGALLDRQAASFYETMLGLVGGGGDVVMAAAAAEEEGGCSVGAVSRLWRRLEVEVPGARQELSEFAALAQLVLLAVVPSGAEVRRRAEVGKFLEARMDGSGWGEERLDGWRLGLCGRMYRQELFMPGAFPYAEALQQWKESGGLLVG
ncbi:hypothetical protein Agub_g10744 [Astrephomene gubernaculifera]|uniref:Uncharacterized protein n=1 Tax=Astrephomene gubernaculifera TaxID=47775 RepID=A0AAD3DVD9_9CHLO|nr:hypothetical protein Agub_g10744 [Astrephomene gubernaculifera]